MEAVIPAAGKGIRMQDITAGTSKEALVIGGRTILDRVIDEVFESGVSRAVVVISRDKPDLEQIVSRRSEPVDLKYQSEPIGLMDAILASGVVEDCLVALPDTIFSTPPCSTFSPRCRFKDSAVCVQKVTDEDVNKYGMVEIGSDGIHAKKFIEKPSVAQTSSRYAIAARYFFTDRVLRFLRELQSFERGQDVPLTEAFNDAIQRNMQILAHQLSSEVIRFDCGSVDGYRAALEHFGK